MNTFTIPPLLVPLGEDAHHFAKQFAIEQATPQKGKQVYLNTLAVCAVRDYLNWLGIPTALHLSDCWNPNARSLFDIADLVLPDAGRLECRPLLPDREVMTIPLEGQQHRIGWVAVRFDETLKYAQLEGFAPSEAIAPNTDTIPLRDLDSLDALVDAIHHYEHRVSLSQWLDGFFQSAWQPIDSILAEYSLAFRRAALPVDASTERSLAVTRAKAISLSSSMSDGRGDGASDGREEVPLIFFLKISQEMDEVYTIQVRLMPHQEATHLPLGLQVAAIDEAGQVCMETAAGATDNWIQIAFTCKPHEAFTVRVAWGDRAITEQFFV